MSGHIVGRTNGRQLSNEKVPATMRAAVIIIAALLGAAIWYGFKLQEPCTAKGGQVVQKGQKYVCERDGQVLE